VSYGSYPVHFPSRKSKDLLFLLLLQRGQPMDRDQIAEWLWPLRLPGKARRSLSTALWRLRQALRSPAPSSPPYLLSEQSTLAFNTDAPYWFDVEAFEQQASLGLSGSLPCTETHRRALEEALDLYGGDLLEDSYDDWCLGERERLRLCLLRVLKHLQCEYRLCQSFEQAVACGYRSLGLDPLQEDVHRELMRCYVDAGQRPLALEQFQRCRETLRSELDIGPMPETWALHRQIRAGREPTSAHGSQDAYRDYLQTAMTQVRRALDVLEFAWESLQTATAEFAEGGDLSPPEPASPENS
jgi:DNA-binding SARP family transcriptional activator